MKARHLAVPLIIVTSSTAFSTIIVNDSFDDDIVTGWQSVGNTLGATHNITESGGTLSSQVIATQANNNTHRGIVSEVSFDPSAETAGFSMTFVVSSQGALPPGVNGLFLGLTSDDSVFFRTAPTQSFGLTLFGFAARTQSEGGVSLVTNDVGTGGSATDGLILGSNPNSIQLASLQDGFTAVISANPSGWSYSMTAINDPAGTPISLGSAGTWADAGSDYDSVFGSDPSWHVLASNQGDPSSNTHTVVFDEISLTTIPEPSSALLGCLGILFALRRRSR